MLKKILNFALFQVGWFAAILAAGHGRPFVALAAGVAAIGITLWLFSADRMGDLRLLLTVALIGFCIDTVNLHLGVFSLVGAPLFPRLGPLWLASLWGLLGTTLRGSLSWLNGKYVLGALLGAVAGPLSYVGGVDLGAANMPADRTFSVAVLAVCWAAAMPLFIWLAHGQKRCQASAVGSQG